MNRAVLGLGYGDEGKGLLVSHLCQSNPHAVVRFSGGPQASHKVMINGKSFVFSHLGSGSLQGVPTYWMRHCPVEPRKLIYELDDLIALGIDPVITIDPRCPVITPYDQQANQIDKIYLHHGTCGWGVGKTLEREEKLSLVFEDLFNETVLLIKLEQIRKYYSATGWGQIDDFLDCCKRLKNKHIRLSRFNKVFDDLVFEGSQGILLDKRIGFFPHVTRSHTDLTNIPHTDEVYFVTRAYQTRHGNGPMTNEDLPHTITLSEHEHNKHNVYQGAFRISVLDLDLINYALMKVPHEKRNLVVTCLDNSEDFRFTHKKELSIFKDEKTFMSALLDRLPEFKKILVSRSPYSEKVEEF